MAYRTLIRREATLLVLDGLSAIEAKAGVGFEKKRFTHELQILASATNGPVAGVVEIGSGVISGLCNEPDSAVRRRWRLHHGSA
jgi:hypothetical protein